ncbi:MAG: GtrA family protein [Gammaproteobacteria bacterium]
MRLFNAKRTVMLHRQLLRFLLAGGLNTLLTLALYQLLLLWWPYPVAFSTAFICGIVFTGLVYTRFVFEVSTTRRRFTHNALYYLLSYGLSLGLLSLLVDQLGIAERLAVFITIAGMVPLNFFCLRRLLQSRSR